MTLPPVTGVTPTLSRSENYLRFWRGGEMDTVEEHNSDIYGRVLGPPMRKKILGDFDFILNRHDGKKNPFVWFIILNSRSFQHSLVIVWTLTTTVCLCAKRETSTSLLLKQSPKYHLTSSSHCLHSTFVVTCAGWNCISTFFSTCVTKKNPLYFFRGGPDTLL